MKISLNWIEEILGNKIAVSHEELSRTLVNLGFEIASIQNFRREMYCSLRLRSLSLLNMAILLLDVYKFVQIQRHVSQIVQRRARCAIAGGILGSRGVGLLL